MTTPLNQDHHFPQVAACFLLNFDTSVGYKFVWSKINEGLDLTGLEYKCLPSGLHEKSSDTILIAHKVGTRIYYGVCRFLQNLQDHEENQQIDRSDVKMYAVGILCEPLEAESSPALKPTSHSASSASTSWSASTSAASTSSASWKLNEFAHNGWEYLDTMNLALKRFLASNDFNNFELFDDLYAQLRAPSPKLLNPRGIENHLLNKLPTFLKTLGPLTFCLYKQALLRKRVLFFQQNHSQVSNFDIGAFTYLLSLISIVPKGIEVVKGVKRKSGDEPGEDEGEGVPLTESGQSDLESGSADSFSRPIYSIGLNDLGGTLAGSPATIGCTNDTILMYQRYIFDYAVFVPCEEYSEPFIVASKTLANNHGHTPTPSDGELRATLKDYYKFKLVYKDYFNRSRCNSGNSKGGTNAVNDDNSSIKTKSSSFSMRFGSQFMKLTNPKDFHDIDLEPSWWLETATSPISWREYIWSAFSWFASAGTVSETAVLENSGLGCEENENNNEATAPAEVSNSESSLKSFLELLEIVGNFHKLTKKWFYLINEVIVEELDIDIDIDGNGVNQSLITEKIKIELTYQDIIDMELDPYSHEDLDFVKEFVLLYWGDVVESVDIGLGLSGICC